ncbi:LysR substrate-binding domain-containing protein [Massilia sp. CMS3.1]|uniref:LysR substrate-binding domain-containing protein n=1 Tax=Massilia sp. CMS3.1 TaxID=3373083 RepID=UPI003EE61702
MSNRVFVSISPSVLRALLQEAMGLSIMDQFNAQDAISSNRLMRRVPDWSLPTTGIYAGYPPGKQVAANVRSFIDFYRQYLGY